MGDEEELDDLIAALESADTGGRNDRNTRKPPNITYSDVKSNKMQRHGEELDDLISMLEDPGPAPKPQGNTQYRNTQTQGRQEYAPPPPRNQPSSNSHASRPSTNLRSVVNDIDSSLPSQSQKSGYHCGKCGNVIQGHYLNAMNQYWHPTCFVCSICRASLQSAPFFNHNGEPNCDNCYKKAYLPPCSKCNKPIQGKLIEAGSAKYCEYCFACGHCGGQFPGGQFYNKDNYLICPSCHTKSSVRCAACNQPISGELVNAMGKTFCKDHFCCGYCQMPLINNPFYTGPDGKPYCKEHINNVTNNQQPSGTRDGGGGVRGGNMCCSCGKLVQGEWVKAMNKTFCAPCFVCAECSNPFPGGKFIEVMGKPYCDVCWGYKFREGSKVVY